MNEIDATTMVDTTVCPEHDEYIVPLITTFSFNGSERWCPFCGYNTGAFGRFNKVKTTPELTARHEKYTEFSLLFLRAKGRLVCVETFYEGKWVKPVDLPEAEKERDSQIIENWEYTKKIEEV